MLVLVASRRDGRIVRVLAERLKADLGRLSAEGVGRDGQCRHHADGSEYQERRAPAHTHDKRAHDRRENSVGWSRIKKSPAFWLLVVAFLFMGLVNGAILPNQVTNMTSVTVNGAKIVTGGHDPMWAGTVLSAYMVTVVIAKISLGAIYDRFGLRFGNVLGSVARIVACVALCFPATDLGPIVAAVSFGVGTCMGTITPTIAASKQFGMADLGKVTGTITSLEMVGGTVGAIVSGVLFDVTGSFASTWIVCLMCSVVMLVFLLASEPIAAKLRASVAGE